MKRTDKEILLKWVTPALVLMGALAFAANMKPAHAADLGGNCCADLEERIAELEATTARKGNRKVSLTVSGQINADYTYVSLDGYNDGRISQSGNDRSTLAISGSALITPDLTAGYVLEIDMAQLGLLGAPVGGDSRPMTRQSFWFIQSKQIGAISIGRQSQATNDFDKYSTNNAWLAGKPLSLGSLSDLYLTGIDIPFDGDYRNSIKYTSPELAGFTLSATWGASTDGLSSDGTGNTYDVALRYNSRDIWKDFRLAGAVGYRRSTDYDVNLLNITHVQIPTGDVDTILVTGSVMHVPTGLFVNGSYANQDWKTAKFTLEGFDVTAGLHESWLPVGATEAFGTYGRISFQPNGGGDTDVDYYGFGMTQALDAAAMDLYVGYRHYDTQDVLGTSVDTVSAGARIKF